MKFSFHRSASLNAPLVHATTKTAQVLSVNPNSSEITVPTAANIRTLVADENTGDGEITTEDKDDEPPDVPKDTSLDPSEEEAPSEEDEDEPLDASKDTSRDENKEEETPPGSDKDATPSPVEKETPPPEEETPPPEEEETPPPKEEETPPPKEDREEPTPEEEEDEDEIKSGTP